MSILLIKKILYLIIIKEMIVSDQNTSQKNACTPHHHRLISVPMFRLLNPWAWIPWCSSQSKAQTFAHDQHHKPSSAPDTAWPAPLTCTPCP